MNRTFSAMVGLAIALLPGMATGQTLQGRIGSASGPGWCAAWLDLAQARDFSAGDRLCIQVNGGPEFLIRLKPYGSPPPAPAGVSWESRYVYQEGNFTDIELTQDHRNVDQISLHACERAWDIEFQEGNGPVVLASIKIESGGASCN